MTTDNPAAADRAALVAGLRALASFLARHPDVPVPPSRHGHLTTITVHPLSGVSDEEGRAFVDRFAAAVGTAAAEPPGSGHYAAVRKFGPVTFKALTVSASAMARYRAEQSYCGSIRPDDEPVAA